MTKFRSEGINRGIARDLGIVLVLTLINTILSIQGKLFDITPKNPAFFIAIAFMVVFGIWFGWRGILAAYLGCLFGVLISLPISIGWAMAFSLADALEVAIPVIAFRFFSVDPALKSRKDIGVYVLFGIVLNSVTGAIGGTLIVFMAGINKSSSMLTYFGTWIGGDMVLIFLITSLMLSFGTPYLRRKGWLEPQGAPGIGV